LPLLRRSENPACRVDQQAALSSASVRSSSEPASSLHPTTCAAMADLRRTLNNRERAALSYFRRKRGIHRRTVSLNDQQFDALEVRGYLNPGRRGNRADEVIGA
jgi:hypothetical protein